MLKLELQERDGKAYLKISCVCDETASDASKNQHGNVKPTEKQVLSIKLKKAPSPAEGQERQSIPEFSPKLYFFEGCLIVRSSEGDYWIYREGQYLSAKKTLELAFAYITEDSPESRSEPSDENNIFEMSH